MKVIRAQDEYDHWPEVATLIHRSFDYMTPLLGHRAQAMDVTATMLATAANTDAAFLVEENAFPVACLFTRPSRDIPGALYLGWLAVAENHRHQGLALALVNAATDEARMRKLTALTLDTGRELPKLHRLFKSMGFQLHHEGDNIARFCKPVSENIGSNPL